MVSVCFPRMALDPVWRVDCGSWDERKAEAESGPASNIPWVSKRPEEARPGKHLACLSFCPHSLSKNSFLSFAEVLSQQGGTCQDSQPEKERRWNKEGRELLGFHGFKFCPSEFLPDITHSNADEAPLHPTQA